MSDLMRCATRLGMGRLRTSAWMLAAVFLAGCGADTGGRVPVAGEVLLDGQPLDRGSIEFHPLDAGGTLTGGMVRDGSFSVPAAQGPKPGKYQVRVFAASSGAEVDPTQPPGAVSEQQVAVERIPPRFNLESELEAEIGDGGNQDLQFDLQSD